jgi:hypothetical protein
MYVVVTGRLAVRFETFTAAFKKTQCQRYLGPGAVLGMGVLSGTQTPDLLAARTTERSIIMTWRDTALEVSASPHHHPASTSLSPPYPARCALQAAPPGPLSISYGHVGCLKARAFPPPV